jgi:hypothetical protein
MKAADNKFNSLDEDITNNIHFLVHNQTYMVAKSDTMTFAERIMNGGYVVLSVAGFVYDGKTLTADATCVMSFKVTMTKIEVLTRLRLLLLEPVTFFQFVIK